ncbi:gluconate 2-dehydrogenase subunit 3 family protein [Phenylobacterium sp. J367]|nr:gluconate 2-dehydrogenase subunit 3 family protein [Phenylobacterium sp. J367]
MPATDTPGAVAAGVPQAIDRALVDWAVPADAERLRAGLGKLDGDAQARHGRPYALLLVADQDAMLAQAEAEWRAQPAGAPMHWFPMLRELVTGAYFTSEIGATQALRYDPVPGAYRACVPLREIGRAWAT